MTTAVGTDVSIGDGCGDRVNNGGGSGGDLYEYGSIGGVLWRPFTVSPNPF